ncbi:putative invertase inhibitor [Setaria italica]|uniref:putative invertase inhibitor n=1 Tax=Setaria italica TaxID=4555 RepID=UPI000647D3FA|nr:putative invertase inhibitor [Setaria italica]
MSSSSMVQPIAIILLAVAIATGLAVGSSSIINATCAALKPLQPYDYCVGVLSADPVAAAATDVRGVAAAAVNITTVKAASTLRVISYLVDELTTCRRYYTNMVKSLVDVLIDFDAGRFKNASLEISANATGVPMDCDILLFEGNAHKDPITQENGENDLLARLASAIIDLLISGGELKPGNEKLNLGHGLLEG